MKHKTFYKYSEYIKKLLAVKHNTHFNSWKLHTECVTRNNSKVPLHDSNTYYFRVVVKHTEALSETPQEIIEKSGYYSDVETAIIAFILKLQQDVGKKLLLLQKQIDRAKLVLDTDIDVKDLTNKKPPEDK